MSDGRTPASRPIASGAVLLLAVSLLGACREGGGDVTTENIVSKPDSAIGACDLLTAEEARTFLGGTVGEPQAGAPMSSGSVRLTDCTWMDQTSDRSVTVTLRRSNTADNTEEAIAGIRAGLASAGAVEDVAGLADEAFWSSGQLHVFQDGRSYLTVSVTGFAEAEGRSTARQVAEAALARL